MKRDTFRRITFFALFFLWAVQPISANTQHVSDGCVGQYGCGGGGASNYSFIYDANGNRLQGFGFWYEYNGFNQLFRVRQGSASGQVVEEYTYDANGIRLTKFEPQLNQMTYYVGEDFVLVENASGVFPETYYHFNGQQVARKDASNATFFSHPDHLGSTTLVTNAAGGVVEETRYEPFGNSLVEFTGQSGRFTYTGKEKDAGTGLMYYGARFYDPVRGQFSQPDSIIPDPYNPQTLNRYAYVLNNPYKFVDKDGHTPLFAYAAFVAVNFAEDMPWLVWDAVDVVASGFSQETSNRYLGDLAISASFVGSTVILGEARIGNRGLKSEIKTQKTEETLEVRNPANLKFTQDTISKNIHDPQGNLVPIVDVIADIKSGKTKPGDFPPIEVTRDKFENEVSLDNRRLYIFKQSGIQEIFVKIVSNINPRVARELAKKTQGSNAGKDTTKVRTNGQS